MGTGVINVPITVQDRMVGFVMNTNIWLFADHLYSPSYWLILKREGFSGNLNFNSVELSYEMCKFDRDDLAEIYRIHHGEMPSGGNDRRLLPEVEHLILSGCINVFVLELDLLTRVGDPYDPLMNESQGFYDSGTPLVATRNQLAEELGRIIGARWLGKDSADQLHWDRSVIAREMVERYDIGAAVVDTVVDFVVGLWELGKFIVTLSAGVAEFKLEIITKAVTGDFEGIKDQLLQLGIDTVNTAQDAIVKAKEGYEILKRLNDDPQTKALLYDFFDSLYQSIHYRDTRTIGIRVITVIGIEVLIALATAGAGNIARIAAATTARVARGTVSAAKNIGPFTLKSIDLLGDLAKKLKSNTKIPDDQLELPPVEPIKIPESGKLELDKKKTDGASEDLEDSPSLQLLDGGANIFDAPRSIEYSPKGSVVFQPKGEPLCGPASCNMLVNDVDGNAFDLNSIIEEFDEVRPTGVNVNEMSEVLNKFDVPNTATADFSSRQLYEAATQNQPVIVGVPAGAGNHFLIVDGIQAIDGVPYYLTRDPLVGPRGVRADILSSAVDINKNAIILGN